MGTHLYASHMPISSSLSNVVVIFVGAAAAAVVVVEPTYFMLSSIFGSRWCCFHLVF